MKWLVVLLGILLWSSPAWAYLGGPDVFEPLGWSAGEQRYYWLEHGWNESGAPPKLYYVALPADSTRREAREVRLADASRRAKLTALRKTLRPLEDMVQPRIARITSVTTDTVTRSWVGDPRPRHLVRGSFDRSQGYQFAIFTFCRPDVFLVHDYAIPGHLEHLIVVAYVGMVDNCEETQEAVLVKPGGAFELPEYTRRW